MMNSTQWLINLTHHLKPSTNIPTELVLSEKLSEAWNQTLGIFQISSMELAQCVAKEFGLKVGHLTDFQPNDISLFPERFCKELKIVQLQVTEDNACIAISDPRLSEDELSRLRFVAGRNIELRILPPEEIDTCLTRFFSSSGPIGLEKTGVLDLLKADLLNNQSSLVKLACSILRMAIEQHASDIHIHPFVGGGAIRFRIDGKLRRIATIPNETLKALARYFKAQAGIDSNPLKPQDGHLRLAYGRREFDVRLSVLPAYDGDRIVCRLLDQSRNFSLQQSSFSTVDQQTLRRMINSSAGIVLMTGPTGSGKTSTLYAMLAELNAVDINIMTIEDPVEYVLPGISQIQVNTKQGLSFADSLRAILRQDPDVVLIGEIRDGETAKIAGQAALTGHLVLSTLHTNDALGCIPRLLDLGLDASILADALLGVVSQRLVRRLCIACRQPTKAPYSAINQEFHRLTGEYPAYHAIGCKECAYTGFSGRLPIIESLEVSPTLRQTLANGEHRLEVLERVSAGYRRSMAASAKDWIISGETTPAEIQDTLGIRFWNDLAYEHGVSLGTININLAQETKSKSRMKLVLLSQNQLLTDVLEQELGYLIINISNIETAVNYLKQNNDVIALIIDSTFSDVPIEDWLKKLRVGFAWTGLPALFVTQAENIAMKTLLTRFEAPHVDFDTTQKSELIAAINLLLQGRVISSS
jgi:type II secretory ATPase GspE/PulE/Tfp pilus assembly ATPase PilB-like protein